LEEPVQYSNNRFCIIDIDKTEQEIADLQEELEKAIRSLTLIPLSSDTLNFYSNKTEEGTYVSGDVKVAETHIFDDVRYKNNLLVTPEGLFIYVNLEYDKENEEFTFTVSNADDTLSSVTVDISDNYLVNGRYSVQDESLHLFMKKGEEIVIDCKYLIAEWDVIGDAAKSPVILTKEEVKYGTEEYSRLEPWQDVLKANVRIKDEEFDPQTGKPLPLDKEKSTNILPGSFTTQLNAISTDSTVVTVGVMVTLPVAVASGALISNVCVPSAAIVAEVGLAVKPPSVVILTVMASVPGFNSVSVLTVPGSTMPKSSTPSL
jgi:hypothetical protein